MIEIKEALKANGCNKETIETCIQAITLIAGDHLKLYQQINALCKSQDDLNHTRSMIAQLGIAEAPKRPYVRKPKDQPSLIEKSGVQAASESLKEQAMIVTQEPKPKRQPRKKETVDETKGAIDETSGGVKLSPEEAAANLTIDL